MSLIVAAAVIAAGLALFSDSKSQKMVKCCGCSGKGGELSYGNTYSLGCTPKAPDWKYCGVCHGTGMVPEGTYSHPRRECSTCSGAGEVTRGGYPIYPDGTRIPNTSYVSRTYTCGDCQGKGYHVVCKLNR
jgi:DnaJ-class molecular chaperone